MATVSRDSIPQLHFSRFVAASLVVIFHFGSEVWPFSVPGLRTVFQNGGLAVGYFFTLSGFLLGMVYRGAKQPFPLKKYFLARFARIYPLYIMAFLLSLAVITGLQKEYPRGFSVIMQALGLHAWVPGMTLSINFPAWSVSVEMFFYALVPFMVMLLQRKGRAFVWISAMVLWVLSGCLQVWLVNQPEHTASEFGDFVLRFPLLHLNAFVLGFACGAAFRVQTALPAWAPLCLLFSGIAIVIASFWMYEPLTHYGTNGLYAPAWLMVILGLSWDRSAFSALLSRPLFVRLGEMSYAVYLLQCPVRIAFAKALGLPFLQPFNAPQFWIYLALLLALSYLSYTFFEAPVRAWLRGQAQS